MTAEITPARGPEDLTGLDALLREYLDWNISQLAETAGSPLDPGDYATRTLAEIDAYLGPRGRLYLVRDGDRGFSTQRHGSRQNGEDNTDVAVGVAAGALLLGGIILLAD